MKFKILSEDYVDAYVDWYKQVNIESDFLKYTAQEVGQINTKRFKKIISNNLKIGAMTVFAAIDDDVIAGALCVMRVQSIKQKHNITFILGVLNNYQGQNIASTLLDMLDAWVVKNAVKRISISVVPENEVAHQMYLRHGYHQEGLRKEAMLVDGKYYDELLLCKCF